MCGTRLALIASMMCGVTTTVSVSGFAQTNIANVIAAADSSRYAAVREYSGDRALPQGPRFVPSNIIAPQSHRALMEHMLRRSAMFRRQCQRIGATPDLLVRVESADVGSPWTRARTNIAKQPDGTLLATVQLAAPEHYVELIAHEFEHIIEQLDGIDLPSRARLGSTGVSRAFASANAFETERAKRIGMMVSAEVRRGDR
jgi:hypothetical protein